MSNLGEWYGPIVDIPLNNEASTYHARSFPILVIHIEAFKKYLERLVAIGILKQSVETKGPFMASIFQRRMAELVLYLISGH